MNFRQNNASDIPTTDLIPMLNVMLGILAFFVIVATSLSSQQSFNLQLPDEVTDSDVENAQAELLPTDGPMIVELNKDGNLIVEEAQLDSSKLRAQIKLFLTQNQNDPIFLKPNRQQSYEKVLQTLSLMRQVGGDRVSLVIDDL